MTASQDAMTRLRKSISPGALGRAAFSRLLGMNASHKRLLKMLFDAASLGFAFHLALALSTESIAYMAHWHVWGVMAGVAAAGLVVFMNGRLYASMGAERDVDILRVSGLGALVSAVLLLGLSAFVPVNIPLGAAVIYLALALCLTGGVRVAVRAMFCDHQVRAKERVLIYGAGDAGRQLLAALRERGEHAPVGFLDDDALLHGARIGGLEVFNPAEIGRAAGATQANAVFLALPSATRARRKRILDLLEPYDLRVQTVPDINDILSGQAPISQIRAVKAEDLLGRDPITPDPELMSATIRGRSVMVTGAGGSIGSELCRQILKQAPARLVMLDQSEFALYEIERALRDRRGECELIAKLGSVSDASRVASLLGRFDVNTVFHCAAYKHVPLVENNVIAAVRNNTLGTLALAREAIKAGVSSFILVSTDKAVRPSSVMGATKAPGRADLSRAGRHPGLDPLHRGALRQCAGFLRLGSATVPPAGGTGRPGHRHPPRRDALFHDAGRGRPAGDPGQRPVGRGGRLRAGHGRPHQGGGSGVPHGAPGWHAPLSVRIDDARGYRDQVQGPARGREAP